MSFATPLMGLIILFAYTAEAMSGFGSIVIAISLGALIFPIDWLMTLLVPLNICMTGYLSWRHRQHIDRTLLLRVILPAMGLGTAAGVWLQPQLGGVTVKLLFAGLVLWFSLRELWRMRAATGMRQRPAWLNRSLIFAAGITHGLFASGGPLLVYGLAGTELDKARLRATLIVVWFSLNAALTVLFLSQGRLTAVAVPFLACLPLLPIGVWLGERLHHRVNETEFRRGIYVLLAIAGIGLGSSSLRQILAVSA